MSSSWIVKAGMISILFVGTLLSGCSLPTSNASNIVTVVGKDFSEQDVLANLLTVMIEQNTDLQVETKTFLGGTDVCFNAVKTGSADMYVEYTGTGYVNILGKKAATDPQTVYDVVKTDFQKEYQLEWLEPIGFNNTYAITITKETAEKYNLKKISDLKAHASSLTLGTTQEFLERPDGKKGLEQAYGFTFKDTKAMNTGLKYTAINGGEVQVIDAYSTDGQLVKHNLVTLEDDLGFFPPYYAAPLVRAETLEKHPEIKEVLNKLAGTINDKEMAALNAKVEVDKQKPKVVATDWLKEKGLISP
ncbi:ABC transporter substrate-binding protein [Brevibacillus daliensis]|uniref:ABC transporter substrate-binding protein n=1 Tax=Brevibacillus daliensis TaxID=2892995 RepID=UPI001E3E3B44|nr:glycine betaine ABC transporter substrate-binding protein [Brevibacillus daliensis]